MTSSRMLEMSALTCEFELSTFLGALHELAQEFDERELLMVVPQWIPSRHHLSVLNPMKLSAFKWIMEFREQT
jgi:hypothetical protein